MSSSPDRLATVRSILRGTFNGVISDSDESPVRQNNEDDNDDDDDDQMIVIPNTENKENENPNTSPSVDTTLHNVRRNNRPVNNQIRAAIVDDRQRQERIGTTNLGPIHQQGGNDMGSNRTMYLTQADRDRDVFLDLPRVVGSRIWNATTLRWELTNNIERQEEEESIHRSRLRHARHLPMDSHDTKEAEEAVRTGQIAMSTEVRSGVDRWDDPEESMRRNERLIEQSLVSNPTTTRVVSSNARENRNIHRNRARPYPYSCVDPSLRKLHLNRDQAMKADKDLTQLTQILGRASNLNYMKQVLTIVHRMSGYTPPLPLEPERSKFVDELYTVYSKLFEEDNSCGVCFRWDVPGLMYLHDSEREDDPWNNARCRRMICVSCYLGLHKKESPVYPLIEHVICPYCRGLPFLSSCNVWKSRERGISFRTYMQIKAPLEDTTKDLFSGAGCPPTGVYEDDYDYLVGNLNWSLSLYESVEDGGSDSIAYIESNHHSNRVALLMGAMDRLLLDSHLDLTRPLTRTTLFQLINVYELQATLLSIRPSYIRKLHIQLKEKLGEDLFNEFILKTERENSIAVRLLQPSEDQSMLNAIEASMLPREIFMTIASVIPNREEASMLPREIFMTIAGHTMSVHQSLDQSENIIQVDLLNEDGTVASSREINMEGDDPPQQQPPPPPPPPPSSLSPEIEVAADNDDDDREEPSTIEIEDENPSPVRPIQDSLLLEMLDNDIGEYLSARDIQSITRYLINRELDIPRIYAPSGLTGAFRTSSFRLVERIDDLDLSVVYYMKEVVLYCLASDDILQWSGPEVNWRSWVQDILGTRSVPLLYNADRRQYRMLVYSLDVHLFRYLGFEIYVDYWRNVLATGDDLFDYFVDGQRNDLHKSLFIYCAYCEVFHRDESYAKYGDLYNIAMAQYHRTVSLMVYSDTSTSSRLIGLLPLLDKIIEERIHV